MLRSRQQSMKGSEPETGLTRWEPDIRVPVLVELIDTLDLADFVRDPAYRRQLNEVLDTFSDEEFDRFERLYTRRFTLN